LFFDVAIDFSNIYQEKSNTRILESIVLPYCHKCGTKVIEEASYCPNCGKKIVVGQVKNFETYRSKLFIRLIKKKRVIFAIFFSVFFIAFFFLPLNRLEEVVVEYVIDGDTFEAFPIGRIRLADIDTPERGQVGYEEAKDFLKSLLSNSRIFVNVDDFYGKDVYGRSVCVVYVEYGSGLKNVNRALLESGLAHVKDYTNEFLPFIWTYYWPVSFLPETYFWQVIPFSLAAIIIIIILSEVIEYFKKDSVMRNRKDEVSV
jgi:endonuclease YncB( thermonuclease family)